MKAMTRRNLLANVTRSHHREAPGATSPSTAVRGKNGGERDDGATNVAGDVPERPPVARRMEIGELCAEPRRQAQRNRRGLECSECIRALRAPELLSRRSGGAAAGRDQRSRAVRERCTPPHHKLRSTTRSRFFAVHRAGDRVHSGPRGSSARTTGVEPPVRRDGPTLAHAGAWHRSAPARPSAMQWHRHRACQVSPEPRGDRARCTPQRRAPRGASTRPCACVVHSSCESPRVNT